MKASPASDPHHHFDGSFLFRLFAHLSDASLTYGHNDNFVRQFSCYELLLLTAAHNESLADVETKSCFHFLIIDFCEEENVVLERGWGDSMCAEVGMGSCVMNNLLVSVD